MVVVTERRDASADGELSARLAPLRRALHHHVTAGGFGVVTLVDDGSGHPVVDRYGVDPADDPGAELMGRRTTVPVGALTTTVTTAMVLLLVEDGAIDLHDPIDELLPELAGRRVLRTIGAPLDDTVPARRSVTLTDLLESRSGLGVGPGAAPGTPVHRAARALGLGVFDPSEARPGPGVSPPIDVDEWLQRLGTLPLLHQPGDRRLGRTDAMVLGALVERLTGKPLPEVMTDRLLAPLHLGDTSFPRADGMVDAAAGLISTVDDVWRFASMLVDGGRAGDASRVLSLSTVRSMLVDRTRAGHPDRNEAHHRGWGLGVHTPAAGSASLRASDGFGMDDIGATWRSNAESGATAVLLAEPGLDPQRSSALTTTFWHGIERAGI